MIQTRTLSKEEIVAEKALDAEIKKSYEKDGWTVGLYNNFEAGYKAGLKASEDTARLNFLEDTARCHILSIGANWYSRKDYGQPHMKHKTLRRAIDFAMQVYKK